MEPKDFADYRINDPQYQVLNEISGCANVFTWTVMRTIANCHRLHERYVHMAETFEHKYHIKGHMKQDFFDLIINQPTPESEELEMFHAFIKASLSLVNWRQLAQRYIDHVERREVSQ